MGLIELLMPGLIKVVVGIIGLVISFICLCLFWAENPEPGGGDVPHK